MILHFVLVLQACRRSSRPQSQTCLTCFPLTDNGLKDGVSPVAADERAKYVRSTAVGIRKQIRKSAASSFIVSLKLEHFFCGLLKEGSSINVV